MPNRCDICDDDEPDLVACINCGARICPECRDWGFYPHDADCGDWFCRWCIDKASKVVDDV